MFVMVPSYVMTVRLLSRRAEFVRNNSLVMTNSANQSGISKHSNNLDNPSIIYGNQNKQEEAERGNCSPTVDSGIELNQKQARPSTRSSNTTQVAEGSSRRSNSKSDACIVAQESLDSATSPMVANSREGPIRSLASETCKIGSPTGSHVQAQPNALIKLKSENKISLLANAENPASQTCELAHQLANANSTCLLDGNLKDTKFIDDDQACREDNQSQRCKLADAARFEARRSKSTCPECSRTELEPTFNTLKGSTRLSSDPQRMSDLTIDPESLKSKVTSIDAIRGHNRLPSISQEPPEASDSSQVATISSCPPEFQAETRISYRTLFEPFNDKNYVSKAASLGPNCVLIR